jgi:hypothetical protein
VSAQIAVVAGAIATKLRNGGEAWVRLTWALGLRELGFDAYIVERVDDATPERTEYFLEVADRFGFTGRACLLKADWEAAAGLEPAEIQRVLADTELLVNVSGHLPLDGPAGKARRKLYVDVDPVYTQVWHEQGADVALDGHDAHVTVGLAIGSAGSAIPAGGIDWIPMPPPVVLSEWPLAPVPADPRFTTVGSWRGGYGRLEHCGRLYGQKAHEFRKLIDLPRRSPHSFELALQIEPEDTADREALVAAGWRLVNPLAVAGTPDAYRAYIQGSAAELSTAQGVYVETGSGWFSDRTAQYLASGRPALVQDTGLGDALPTGKGLLTFSTLDEAVAGADDITRDYDAHAQAARRLAEEYLDAAILLGRLLDQLDGVRGQSTTAARAGARP